MEGLIEIENPNRVAQKSKKVAEVDVSAPRELSRRERWVSNKMFWFVLHTFSRGLNITILMYLFQGRDRKAEIKRALHETSS